MSCAADSDSKPKQASNREWNDTAIRQERKG